MRVRKASARTTNPQRRPGPSAERRGPLTICAGSGHRSATAPGGPLALDPLGGLRSFVWLLVRLVETEAGARPGEARQGAETGVHAHAGTRLGQREAPRLGSQLPRKGFLALGAGRGIAIVVDPAIAERLSARSERTSPWSEARCAEQGASPAPPTLALGGPRESSPVFAGARGQGPRPGASPAAVWAFGPDCSVLMTGCGL